MSEWKPARIGDFVNIRHGYAFTGAHITDKPTENILVSPGNFHIGGGFKSVKFKYYNGEVPDEYILKADDIIVTMTDLSKESDTLGYSARVPASDTVRYLHNQRIGLLQFIESEKESIAPEFLYWLMRTGDYQGFVVGSASGSSVMHTSPSRMREYEFRRPHLVEQKSIAAVLSSLDDKIDLLHRQNQTLEAMAATLFRQWFVEEAGEDWAEIKITELFEVRDGTHDSPKQATIGMPLITSKHILDGGLDIGNAYLISEDDFNKVNQRSKVDMGDILFSMIGTIGLLYLEQSTSIDYAIKNIGLFKTSQNPDWAIYTYLWLKSPEGRQFIDEHKSGSTQEYVALGSLRSITFQKPPMVTLCEFNELASVTFPKAT